MIRNNEFYGGCNGNLKAISKFLEGCTVEEIEETLLGNTCGRRPTSCTDRLAIAIRKAYNDMCGEQRRQFHENTGQIFSRSGNTAKLAASIADAVGTEAKDLTTPLDGKVDSSSSEALYTPAV